MLGIFIMSTFYEVIGQVLDYQMYSYAALSPAYASATSFGQFTAIFDISTNVASFLISLLGTSMIIKRLGIRAALLIYPSVVAIILFTIFGIYTTQQPDVTTLLWIIFGGYTLIKALGYAVNNPIKEMLYIPTSKDVKFKAKSWSDMFGGRFSKAAGARITDSFKHDLAGLMVNGVAISSGLIGIWFVAALYVGFKNHE
jgi:ATP:ADP antiporter, AAA family